MMLDKKQIFFIVIGASCAVLIMWFSGLFVPQIRNLLQVMNQTGKIKAEISTREADIRRIDIFRKKIAEETERIESYEGTFPKKDEVPAILEMVSDFAKDTAVRLVALTPVKTTLDQNQPLGGYYQEVPVLISARCGYHELGAFINKIEAASRFIKVVDIEIRTNKVFPKRHDCELLIVTYTSTR